MSFNQILFGSPGTPAALLNKSASYAATPGSTNAFDLHFDAEDDIGLLSSMPFASLTDDTNLSYPSTAASTGAAPMSANITHRRDGDHYKVVFPLANAAAGEETETAPTASSDTMAALSRSGDSPVVGATRGRPADGHTSGSNSGTGSDCGAASQSTSLTARVAGKVAGSASRKTPLTAGSAANRNKNFFEKITCLPEDNFNVLTPDKHVMLSIPAQYIVPTNGSRNYLKKNRGAACRAEDMKTKSHGNTVACTTADGAADTQAPREKKMFFSFCLCKSFSSVGGRCHHGNECDFIHCLPERLPHVVSTDSGRVIDEIIEKKTHVQQAARGRANANTTSGTASQPFSPLVTGSPPVVGHAGEISTFQVHWSTPITSLEASPYARLPPSRIIYIKKEGCRNNLQALPSEFIYKTIGGVEAVTDVGRRGLPVDTPHPGDASAPLRICKHYEREKCARGPLCHFIHPVVLAESSTKNNFRAFMSTQKAKQAEAQEMFQQSQQRVEQQQQQHQQLQQHRRQYGVVGSATSLAGHGSNFMEDVGNVNLNRPHAPAFPVNPHQQQMQPGQFQQAGWTVTNVAASAAANTSATLYALLAQLVSLNSGSRHMSNHASISSALATISQQQPPQQQRQGMHANQFYSMAAADSISSDSRCSGLVAGFVSASGATVPDSTPPRSMMLVPQECGGFQVLSTRGTMPQQPPQQQQPSYFYAQQ